MRALVRGLILVVCVLNLSACVHGTSPIARALFSTGYVNTSGSHQFFPEETFEQIDLVATLDPDKRRETHLPADTSPKPIPPRTKEEEARIELERAFRAFYTYGPRLEDRRSRLQDRILAASEQRCNTYKNYLKRVESAQSTTAGIMTTLLAGAGAIATHVTSVRTLSGLAGISSGVGAELNQGVFSNVASQVIVPGIDLARSDLRREMLTKRSQSISLYTVEGALIDAARYHGACTMNAGLERAGKAVNEVTNPGVRALNATLGQLNLAQKLARRMTDDTVEITEKDLRIADGISVAGLPNSKSPTMVSLNDPVRSSFFDRYLLTIREIADSLAALKNLVTQKRTANIQDSAKNTQFESEVAAGTCDTGKIKGLERQCQSNKVYAAALTDKTDGNPPTFAYLLSELAKLPSADYRDGLAKQDGVLKSLEIAAYDKLGQPEELKTRYEFRKALIAADAKYTNNELIFETMNLAIASARKAVAGNPGNEYEEFVKAMGAISEQIKALKDLTPLP